MCCDSPGIYTYTGFPQQKRNSLPKTLSYVQAQIYILHGATWNLFPMIAFSSAPICFLLVNYHVLFLKSPVVWFHFAKRLAYLGANIFCLFIFKCVKLDWTCAPVNQTTHKQWKVEMFQTWPRTTEVQGCKLFIGNIKQWKQLKRSYEGDERQNFV